MTSSYQDDIENYYQIAEDADPARSEDISADLIDLATGQPLIDPDTQEQLTGITEETIVLASAGKCTPVVITNDAKSPAIVNPINNQQSEVDTSLLGIPRSETALNLFSAVNIYGVNTKEWASGPNIGAAYKYYRDPAEWTFDGDYGLSLIHI